MSHIRKKRTNKNYYLEEWGSKVCCNKTIKNNKTVYVDIKYGHEIGKINNPKCPFMSINGAINAIRKTVRTNNTQWLIKVNPGFYNELVKVPTFVNIEGSGIGVTSINFIDIEGSSNISNLSIVNNILPLIKTKLDNEDPLENNIRFDNIKVSAEGISDTKNNPVISINGNGLNNNVSFENSEIIADVLRTNPATSNQILFDINAGLQLLNVIIDFQVDFKAITSCFNIKNGTIINGGDFRLSVIDGPEQEVNLYQVATTGLDLLNNTSHINVHIISNPYKADLSYIKSDGASTITILNSTAYLDGVSRDFCNLVENLNANSNIDILSLTIPRISAPRLKGFRDGIKYTVISGNGDVVASGGLYANTINVNATTHHDGYFLQEDDFTVFSDAVNVHVFDPALANRVVTNKGKIIIIRNIGTSPIIVDSQDNSIFDGNQTLQPGQSVMLQNDAILWYKVSN